MAPRPKSTSRRNWPYNLTAGNKGGKLYFRYRNPLTGKETGMGADQERAIQAARILNAKIAPEWFQIALDAALQTLQRREDLVEIRLDGTREKGLEIIQRKTGLKLVIPCGPELTTLISRSRASNIPSPT